MKIVLALTLLQCAVTSAQISSPDVDRPKALFAYLHIRPGKENQLEALAQKLIVISRQEPGNLTYILNHSVKDPQLFVFYELYRSESDLQRHRAAPYVQDFLTAVGPMLAPNGFSLEEFEPLLVANPVK